LCVCFTRALLSRATKRVKSWFKMRSFQTGNSTKGKGEGGREKNKKAFWCIKKYQQSTGKLSPLSL